MRALGPWVKSRRIFFHIPLHRHANHALSTVILVLMSIPLWANADENCGQTTTPPYPYRYHREADIAAEPVTIDYAVFYTPESREAEGGTEQILQKISAAFISANQLFELSGSNIGHRIVHTQELPINNTSQTLPELGTELATQFDFFSVLDASAADTSVTIVKFQIPGGFANIPQRPGLASRGGSINLGLGNVSGAVLAHEIGHTLGASHDYPDVQIQSFETPPTYNYGNHFIGASGTCYRTIMSALPTCRIPGFTGVPAVSCNRFSSPALVFDGVPTGDAVNSDTVRLFSEFAPFLAIARSSEPPAPQPSPPATNEPGGNDDISPTPPITGGDVLTLTLERVRGKIVARGKCLSESRVPLRGDGIDLLRANQRTGTSAVIASTTCNDRGRFRFSFRRSGRFTAVNVRTGTKSSAKRI